MPAEAHFTNDAISGPAMQEGLVEISSPDVVLTALKQQKDGDGIILRLYEIAGISQAFEIKWNGPALSAVHLVDGAENEIRQVEHNDNSFGLEIPAEGILNIHLIMEKK